MNIIHKGQVIATYPTAQPLPGFEFDVTITSPSSYHRPANQTRELILEHVETCGERSVLEIARHLQRKPTPFLRSQIKALVEVGLLVEQVQQRPNGMRKFIYRAAA